jgi:hypothetical protein
VDGLVFAGLTPDVWEKERKDIGGFDVFMTVRGVSYMVEDSAFPIVKTQVGKEVGRTPKTIHVYSVDDVAKMIMVPPSKPAAE